MASIGGVDLGIVQTEESTKSSNLFNQPLPYSDSDEALMMDLFGASRTITLTGIYEGTTAEQITFVNAIEALQNGQQSGMTFVSDWTSPNKTCLIQDFSHAKKAGEVTKIEYTITLLEGTAL